MLISEQVAIVPVGVSCLNGFQLDRCASFLGNRFGVDFKISSSFFKWVIQDPRYIGKFFDVYVRRKKNISSKDLGIENGGLKCTYLKDTVTWFMHDYLGEGPEQACPDGTEEDRIQHVVSKYNYLLEKVRKVASVPKRYFIFGNGDLGPLDWELYRKGYFGWRFSKHDVENLCDSINKAFPEGENHFIFVASNRNIIRDLDCCHIFVTEDSHGFPDLEPEWDVIFSNLPEHACSRADIAARNITYLSNYRPRSLEYTSHSPSISVRDEFVNRSGDVFDVNARDCNFLWGPYIRLATGFYEASVHFVPYSFHGTMRFDVTSDFANNVIVEADFDYDRVFLDWTARLRFKVGEDLHNMEVHLSTTGHFQGKISKISIRKV